MDNDDNNNTAAAAGVASSVAAASVSTSDGRIKKEIWIIEDDRGRAHRQPVTTAAGGASGGNLWSKGVKFLENKMEKLSQGKLMALYCRNIFSVFPKCSEFRTEFSEQDVQQHGEQQRARQAHLTISIAT